MLVQLVVDAIKNGFRDANDKFNKLTVDTRILAPLNKSLGINKTNKEYKNRMKILKGKYLSLADLLRFSSRFGWDSETKKFTATEEVWNDYLKAHPNKTHLRNESFEDFKDLQMIFGSNIATGKNAVGLGDADAYTNLVGDNEGINDSNHVQTMDDTEGIAYEDTFVEEVFSTLEKRRREKLSQRKKARTDVGNSDKAFDDVNEVTEISQQIFSMIQKRWERETEEKEAEDKANNVWDAIKEIPDLEEDLRYEAMTLVHSLGTCLFTAPPFPYKTQADLVLACAVLHNYLRQECRSDLFLLEDNVLEENDTDERDDGENNEEEQLHGTQEQQRVVANNWRATIAANMWTDAMNMGS